MKKLLIENLFPAHYEIVESVIIKYNDLFNNKINNVSIYLSITSPQSGWSVKDNSFKKYINDKYPDIIFQRIHEFDYYVNCTVYDKDYYKLNHSITSNEKYISHEITDRLKQNPNVFFLTPLSKNNYMYADVLPFTNFKKKPNIPIYIIQGCLNNNRRHLPLLIKILSNKFNFDYKIKLIGRGHFPNELIPFKEKIILKDNLNFIDYHKEFVDGYCILPLISKQSHPHYYTNKLTSTINYAKAYNLKCIIDKDLQNIYNLKNTEIYNNDNDIVQAFRKTLHKFYL